jgi:hypothetical protein
MQGTVANRLIPVNFAYLQNSALQPYDLAHRVGAAGLRIDPVESGTGTRKIKVKLRPEENPGRRGEAGRQLGETPSRSSKALELDVIERMFWFVRTGEMAEQGAPSDRIGTAQLVGEPVEFLDGQAEAGHTRIDMQNGRPFPVPHSGGSPIGDLPGIVENRDEAEFEKNIHATGQQTVKDGDFCRFGQYLAKCDPFIDRCDKKSAASGRGQGGRYQRGAQAVRIGLDHGCASRRVNPPRQKAPIRRNPCEIDFEDSARAVGGIACHVKPIRGRLRAMLRPPRSSRGVG